jgi:hypothetical protein
MRLLVRLSRIERARRALDIEVHSPDMHAVFDEKRR